MKLVKFIFAIIISQIFVFEETRPYGKGINLESIDSFLLVFSWIYFIYILIMVYKIRGVFSSHITIHKWLIPVTTMVCIESLLIFVGLPLLAKIFRPIALALYYLWISRFTMLLTVPISYIIIKILIKKLSNLPQNKS